MGRSFCIHGCPDYMDCYECEEERKEERLLRLGGYEFTCAKLDCAYYGLVANSECNCHIDAFKTHCHKVAEALR